MNRVERELARSAGLPLVRPGDRVWMEYDWLLIPAEQGMKVMDAFLEAGHSTIAYPERIVFFSLPQKEQPSKVEKLRSFCLRFGMPWFDSRTDDVLGELIQAFSMQKGMVVAGTERYGIHFGAFGLISLSVSVHELGSAMATGKMERVIPDTVYIDISGRLPRGVTVRDISSHLYDHFDQDGLTGKAVIVGGSGLQRMHSGEWMTLTRGIRDMGGEIGLIALDGPRGQVEKVVKVKAEDICVNSHLT